MQESLQKVVRVVPAGLVAPAVTAEPVAPQAAAPASEDKVAQLEMADPLEMAETAERADRSPLPPALL